MASFGNARTHVSSGGYKRDVQERSKANHTDELKEMESSLSLSIHTTVLNVEGGKVREIRKASDIKAFEQRDLITVAFAGDIVVQTRPFFLAIFL